MLGAIWKAIKALAVFDLIVVTVWFVALIGGGIAAMLGFLAETRP